MYMESMEKNTMQTLYKDKSEVRGKKFNAISGWEISCGYAVVF